MKQTKGMKKFGEVDLPSKYGLSIQSVTKDFPEMLDDNDIRVVRDFRGE